MNTTKHKEKTVFNLQPRWIKTPVFAGHPRRRCWKHCIITIKFLCTEFGLMFAWKSRWSNGSGGSFPKQSLGSMLLQDERAEQQSDFLVEVSVIPNGIDDWALIMTIEEWSSEMVWKEDQRAYSKDSLIVCDCFVTVCNCSDPITPTLGSLIPCCAFCWWLTRKYVSYSAPEGGFVSHIGLLRLAIGWPSSSFQREPRNVNFSPVVVQLTGLHPLQSEHPAFSSTLHSWLECLSGRTGLTLPAAMNRCLIL